MSPTQKFFFLTWLSWHQSVPFLAQKVLANNQIPFKIIKNSFRTTSFQRKSIFSQIFTQTICNQLIFDPWDARLPNFTFSIDFECPLSPTFCFQKSSSSSSAPSSAQKQLVLLYKYWLNIFISEFFDFVNSTISSFSYFHHFASFLLFQERKKVRRGLEQEQRTA